MRAPSSIAMTAAAALCVLLALAAAPGGALAQKQCGGTQGCEAHSSCNPEAPWTDVRCPAGTTCTRKSKAVWACLSSSEGAVPAAVAAAAAALAENAAPAGSASDATMMAPADDPMSSAEIGSGSGGGSGSSGRGAGASPASASGAPRSYPGMTSGPRKDGDPAVKTCACVDAGLNDPSCFKGITDYCTNADPPANMTVCEAMSGFFNMQNVTAAQVASEFFVRVCALTLPANPSPCACLEGAASDGCRAATVGACRAKDAMCPALAFGAEGGQESMEAYARYMNENCGGALAAAQVGLNFTDMTKETFLAKYAKGTAAALAVISGQPLPSVLLMPPRQIKVGSLADLASSDPGKARAAPAPGGRRRLAQKSLKAVDKVLVQYQIRSSEADAKHVLEQLQLAAENGGEGLYKALKANGVPLRPSFSVQDGPPLVGAVPRRTLTTDKKEPIDRGEAIGVGVGVAGGVLVVAAGVAALVISRKRHNAAAKKAAAAAAQRQASGVAAAAADGGIDEKKAAVQQQQQQADVRSSANGVAAS